MQNLFVTRLELFNFKNYALSKHVFDFRQKYVFIIGANASGKSNLLKALQLVSLNTESNFSQEEDFLSFQASQEEPFFQLKVNYLFEKREFQLDFLKHQNKKRLSINRIEYPSINKATEKVLKTISFQTGTSIELVSGSPSLRRNWLDQLLCLLSPKYNFATKKYKKALEQKNSLLKSFSQSFSRQVNSKQALLEEITPWNHVLARAGYFIYKKRERFFDYVKELFSQEYQKISGQFAEDYYSYSSASSADSSAEIAELKYQPCLKEIENEESLLKILDENLEQDLFKKQALIGTHKDDFDFLIGEKKARVNASQGQKRTCALALKFLQLKLWSEKLGYSPVLLLDDVLAELDLKRQKALFEAFPKDSQVFLTTTHLSHLPKLSEDLYQIIELG